LVNLTLLSAFGVVHVRKSVRVVAHNPAIFSRTIKTHTSLLSLDLRLH
jgi:hypothetical protein